MRIRATAASLGLAVGSVLGLTAAAAVGQTPGFHLVGHAPGTDFGEVQALSQDGAVAAGVNIANSVALAVGFTWTAGGGRQDLTGPGVPSFLSFNAANSGGGVLAGLMRQPVDRAFRYAAGGQIQDLGVLPNHHSSYGLGVSGNGDIVVGFAQAGASPNLTARAFRWTAQTGMQDIGHLRPAGTTTHALDISRNGSTIVGASQSFGTFGAYEAFKWTQGGGMVQLPGLPGAPTGSWVEANAVNADGSVVVGNGEDSQGRQRALRWTSAGVEDLGTFPGVLSSLAARAVSDNGQIVGVNGTTGPAQSTAFVWTPMTGPVLLSDYLALFGVSVTQGWRLQSVHAVSGDGLTFAGEARSTAGVRQGFVATVPAPSGAIVVLGSALLFLRRRRAVR